MAATSTKEPSGMTTYATVWLCSDGGCTGKFGTVVRLAVDTFIFFLFYKEFVWDWICS